MAFELAFYLSRSTDPYTNRFIQPDSIVPNPANPQSWNRFSYVRNNPIKFNDPTGHLEEGECSFNNLGCEEMPEQQPPIGKHIGDDGSKKDLTGDWKGGPIPTYDAYTIQLSSDEYSRGIFITIFPPGTSPAQFRTDEQLKIAYDLSGVGGAMDVIEIILVAFPGDLVIGEYFASFLDVGITGTSCIYAGECYIGPLHPSLPDDMVVINQDVLITSVDFGAPIASGLLATAPTGGTGFAPASMATDYVTSIGSLVYDNGRMLEDIPNYISIGVTQSRDIYVLIYP